MEGDDRAKVGDIKLDSADSKVDEKKLSPKTNRLQKKQPNQLFLIRVFLMNFEQPVEALNVYLIVYESR